MSIRPYREEDRAEWLRMRRLLRPEITDDEADGDSWLAQPDTSVLVAERPFDQGLAGFAEVGARPYADGCDTSPVAFLEG